jgi:ABC-2 type transport system ATP-binding protein
MASIRTAGLAKNFGDLRAVNEIDLDLPEGGVAGFVGPNGAGKSTTIRMLLGLITPTGGEGEVFGHPIGRPAAYLHRFNRPTTPTYLRFVTVASSLGRD